LVLIFILFDSSQNHLLILNTPATLRKQALLTVCRARQQAKADDARYAMNEAQASANDASGAMEDKYESFRENCQIQRDMFARQLDEALLGLGVLLRIDPAAPPHVTAGLGAMVETDRGARFFIAISLGVVPVGGEAAPWLVMSTQSPIGQALLGRKVGDTFVFRSETHRITAIE
jgi:hypothetical protein